MRRLRFALVVLVFLTGCRFETTTNRLGPKLAPTKPETVEVWWSPPAKHYQVVGTIATAADAGTSIESWNKHFRHEAAKIGGEGVIILNVGGASSSLPVQVGAGYVDMPTVVTSMSAYVVRWVP